MVQQPIPIYLLARMFFFFFFFFVKIIHVVRVVDPDYGDNIIEIPDENGNLIKYIIKVWKDKINF